MDDRTTGTPQPDIIDVFIILLLASAIDIFLFWMATQFTNNPVFQKLPDFVNGAYSGVWTSVATGTAGIGLVIVKYLSRGQQYHVNYFLYVSATAVGLFVLIIATSFISLLTGKWQKQDQDPPKPSVPLGSFHLDIPADGTDQIFDQSDSVWYWNYNYKGTIALKDKKFKGTLQPSNFKTSQEFKPLPEQTIKRINADICYWKLTNGFWSVDWFPDHSTVNNSIEFDVQMATGMNVITPKFDFIIDQPENVDLKEAWLCYKFDFNGGFIPIPHW